MLRKYYQNLEDLTLSQYVENYKETASLCLRKAISFILKEAKKLHSTFTETRYLSQVLKMQVEISGLALFIGTEKHRNKDTSPEAVCLPRDFSRSAMFESPRYRWPSENKLFVSNNVSWQNQLYSPAEKDGWIK